MTRKTIDCRTVPDHVGCTLAISGEPGELVTAGSALQRFGTFRAGVASAKDPKYVVVPQRERLDAANSGRAASGGRPS